MGTPFLFFKIFPYCILHHEGRKIKSFIKIAFGEAGKTFLCEKAEAAYLPKTKESGQIRHVPENGQTDGKRTDAKEGDRRMSSLDNTARLVVE